MIHTQVTLSVYNKTIMVNKLLKGAMHLLTHAFLKIRDKNGVQTSKNGK